MMHERSLPISSYVILGLLEGCGPMTPYELKKHIDSSIGNFWEFPRAQLYIDPERMTQLGLVHEERETEGRRRKTYSITAQGKATLQQWLHDMVPSEVELHDAGLLKLYFGHLLTQDEVVHLARAQMELHCQRLIQYQAIAEQEAHHPAAAFALATLQMGLRYEAMSIAYWQEIAERPPTISEETKQPPTQ